MWAIKATIDDREYVTSVAVNGEEIPIMYFDEVLDNFKDNTIDGIITACRTNTVPDTWLIGDKKTFTMNDTEYHLVIIGKNVDTLTNGNTAPLTFQFEEIHANSYMYVSSETVEISQWADSRVRRFYNSSNLANYGKPIYETFRDAIVPVTKETRLVDGTIQITEDRIFIPSYEEMKENGMYYEYFQTKENRIKTLDGTATVWWTRTPYNNSRKFYVVNETGTFTNGSGYRGVSPAFCLGSETMFTNSIKVGDTILTEEELIDLKAQNEEIESIKNGNTQVGNASHAQTASLALEANKATQDANGNVIADTYATKNWKCIGNTTLEGQDKVLTISG